MVDILDRPQAVGRNNSSNAPQPPSRRGQVKVQVEIGGAHEGSSSSSRRGERRGEGEDEGTISGFDGVAACLMGLSAGIGAVPQYRA